MANYRRRGSYPVRGVRRKTAWDVGPDSSAGTTTQTASGSIILGQGSEVQQDGLTLVRLRGEITAILTLAGANEGFQGAMGIGIVTAEAFAVGVTACPLPVTDVDWDGWLWWQPFIFRNQAASITTAANQLIEQKFPVDTKAMRKLNIGDTICTIIQVEEVGTCSIFYFQDSRILIKLP